MTVGGDPASDARTGRELRIEPDLAVFMLQFGFHNPAGSLSEPGEEVISVFAIRWQIEMENGIDQSIV